MATRGTRNTEIAFGDFTISVSLAKASKSRDLKTEIVDAEGRKLSGGGGGYGGGRRKPDGEAGESRAVRVSDDIVIRLPQDELDAIEQASKDRWGRMEVLEAIDYRQVPTERIDGSYWLQPSAGSAQGLYLLHRALSEQDKVAVVKWVSTSREKLGVIRPRRVGGKRALLLSELVFANDFAEPDEDALAINEAEVMMAERDPEGHACAVEQAIGLISAFARERGDDKFVETASDEAVDARLALLERVQAQAMTAALEASTAAASEPDVEGGEVVSLDSARSAA